MNQNNIDVDTTVFVATKNGLEEQIIVGNMSLSTVISGVNENEDDVLFFCATKNS